MQATCLRLSALSDPLRPLLESFIIVIYLQLKMPNIYLILSILQFICLPNRSSNKSAPSPIPIPLCPPHPALLSDIRLGVSIAISRENFQFSTRAVRGGEKKRSKSEPKNKLAGGDRNQSLQSAPLCRRRQC